MITHTSLVDVAVIGAGPAGLHAAGLLIGAGLSVVVLEGRDRVGGRLLSVDSGNGGKVRLDLGATWFWSNETRTNAIVADERLHSFAQHLAGDAMFQNDQGTQRMAGNQIDAPSGRLQAGTQSIAQALAERLPAGVLELNRIVDQVGVEGDVVVVRTGAYQWHAAHVIVAVPPATAVSRIDFGGSMAQRVHNLAAATPVWMGNMVKIVAQYERPFWRDAGLAGAAFSYTGPAREIHDMSGDGGSPAALFGFAQPGAGQPAPSQAEVLRQLVDLFGDLAASPTALFVHDWRLEPLTSPDNVDDLAAYQTFGHPLFAEPMLGGRGHWASTETATTAPGHIEGALQAAERAAAAVLKAARDEDRPR